LASQIWFNLLVGDQDSTLLHKIEEVFKKKNPASNQLNIATQYVVVEPPLQL
jgi:hypothetical protein